ncbi:MAG: hypothetical protein QXL94_05465 [Candidatus Parvarchaeum sp.]
MSLLHFTLIKYEDITNGRISPNIRHTLEDSYENCAGVYFYVARTESKGYPFKPSKIVYIGKADNLADRIKWHFSTDMNKKFPNSETLIWPYQNYYSSKSKVKVDIVLNKRENASDFEILLLAAFLDEHGAPPICNGSIQRKLMVEKIKTMPKKFSEAKKILEDVEIL